MPPLAPILLLVAAASPTAERHLVYVALGGFVESGGARAGDPARVADRLEGSGTRVRLMDLTAPGATIRDVRNAQLHRAMAAKPSLVTVAVGVSDVRGACSLRGFSRDLHIVADLLHRTDAVVVISTLPGVPAAGDQADRAFRRRVEAFNWAIVRIARRHGFGVANVRTRPGVPDTSWEAAVATAFARQRPRSSRTR